MKAVKEMWRRVFGDSVVSLLRDTALLAGYLLLLIVLYLFVLDRISGGRLFAAPTPFPKKERTVYINPDSVNAWHGAWRYSEWGEWDLQFMHGGVYQATLNRGQLWEGEWRLSREGERVFILIDEHPAGNPGWTMSYRIPSEMLKRHSLRVTD